MDSKHGSGSGSSVTVAAAKSSSQKILSLNGHSPQDSKPCTALSGVAVFRYARPKIAATLKKGDTDTFARICHHPAIALRSIGTLQ